MQNEPWLFSMAIHIVWIVIEMLRVKESKKTLRVKMSKLRKFTIMEQQQIVSRLYTQEKNGEKTFSEAVNMLYLKFYGTKIDSSGK